MAHRETAPELLAPAGDMSCLHAAVMAGADAVYLGLDEFNARRNAGNFGLDDLAQACDYAHLRGAKVYVTMNVEILQSELDRALQLARSAYLAGADAFIVQDLGLALALRRQLPQARLHISTQMNIHNAAGVAAVARLGAKRITLARELSLSEIAELSELAAGFGMEVECFAHGALCVCYSGQCLMSSMIGGRSANRGLCAQACRLPYELHASESDAALAAPGEHLLSPRDLCTADLLGELASAGVASLKVEGRMKSADYVFEVVSVYRELLDAGGPATEGQRARLAEAFSRGFTTAYLEGQRGNDIMSYGRPNNRGVFAGRVSRVADGVAALVPEMELHSGDVLEFWTNRGHFAATVDSAEADARGEVSIAVDRKVGKGDRVFRVRNAAAQFEDDPLAPRVPATCHVTLKTGEPAHVRIAARGADGSELVGEAWGKAVEPARTKALAEEDVRAHVNRLGQTPFTFEHAGELHLTVDLDDGAGMGFSQLHHLRAEAIDNLEQAMLAPYRSREARAIGTRTLSQGSAPLRQPASIEVVAWATNPACARAARRARADAVYVPLLNFKRGQSQEAGLRREEAEQAGYPKQCVMALPAVDHDPVAPYVSPLSGRAFPGTREYELSFDMWDYVREGKRVFADSLAGALRALELGAQVELGPHVPIVNESALELAAELGVSRVWLSPELTLGQVADLAQASPVPLGLVVAGAQELMITEHCLLMSQGPCAEACETCARRSVAHRLRDRKGFEFPVVTDLLGRSHLYNGIELDAVPFMPDLADIGISAVMVDTTLMEKKSASDAVGRAVRARDLAASEHRAVGKRANTTTGHLFRGVS